MSGLVTTRNLADPDGVYATLIAAHDGLDEAASAALNARLILTLFNHIGDAEVIEAAIALARYAAPAPTDAGR